MSFFKPSNHPDQPNTGYKTPVERAAGTVRAKKQAAQDKASNARQAMDDARGLGDYCANGCGKKAKKGYNVCGKPKCAREMAEGF